MLKCKAIRSVYDRKIFKGPPEFLKVHFHNSTSFLALCSEGENVTANSSDERKITRRDRMQDEMINSCGCEEGTRDPEIGSFLASAKSIMMCEQVSLPSRLWEV